MSNLKFNVGDEVEIVSVLDEYNIVEEYDWCIGEKGKIVKINEEHDNSYLIDVGDIGRKLWFKLWFKEGELELVDSSNDNNDEEGLIKRLGCDLSYIEDDNEIAILKSIDVVSIVGTFGFDIVKNAYQKVDTYYKNIKRLDSDFERGEVEEVLEIVKLKEYRDANFDISHDDVYIEFVNGKIVQILTSEWGDIDALN